MCPDIRKEIVKIASKMHHIDYLKVTVLKWYSICFVICFNPYMVDFQRKGLDMSVIIANVWSGLDLGSLRYTVHNKMLGKPDTFPALTCQEGPREASKIAL